MLIVKVILGFDVLITHHYQPLTKQKEKLCLLCTFVIAQAIYLFRIRISTIGVNLYGMKLYYPNHIGTLPLLPIEYLPFVLFVVYKIHIHAHLLFYRIMFLCSVGFGSFHCTLALPVGNNCYYVSLKPKIIVESHIGPCFMKESDFPLISPHFCHRY